jgi:hypothetical protein
MWEKADYALSVTAVDPTLYDIRNRLRAQCDLAVPELHFCGCEEPEDFWKTLLRVL